MKKLFARFFCAASIFLLTFSCALATTSTNNNKIQACFSYDKAIEVNDGTIYQAPQAMKNVDGQSMQKWNNYCPPCTLKDPQQCANLPCQTYNIKASGTYNNIEVKSDRWMEIANQEALYSVQHGGGPFGAVIVQIDDRTGKVLRYWANHNHVVEWNDPTAHAEVSTIRAATKQLGVLDLGHIRKEESKLPQPGEWSHCVIYSSAEPCPMCLSAIYWAGIKTLIFSATRYDAAAQGVNFSDEMIYEELQRPYSERQYMSVKHANTDNSLSAFNYYKRNAVARYGEAP